MADTLLIGRAHIFGIGTYSSGTLTPATLAQATAGNIAGYITPNLQTARVSDTAVGKHDIKNQAGVVSGIIFVLDDIIECTFDFIPESSSGTNTVAGALASMQLPSKGSYVTVAGLPVVPIGSFADALNASTTNPWLYEGGATINLSSESNATMTLPLRRLKGIAAATPLN